MYSMKKEKNITMFPEVWDELTESDWIAMLKLREQLIRKPKSGITIDDIRLEAARCLLLNRGIRTRLSDDKYFMLVRTCGMKIDWLWQEREDGSISLVYRSTVNLLQKFGHLYGPMSHGGDLEFGEFKEALTLVSAYDADENHPVALLQQLAGLLYRLRNPKRSFPRRVPYDTDTPLIQLTRGQRLPAWFLWGVYAWFSFFCEYLTTGIFIIDGQEVCFKEVFAPGEKSSDAGGINIGLNGIALTLAESGVFGDFDDVLHTPLMRVMMKLLHDSNTRKQEEKALKKR